jgi:hypothetical protein
MCSRSINDQFSRKIVSISIANTAHCQALSMFFIKTIKQNVYYDDEFGCLGAVQLTQ